jgi:hypothetical protein
MHEYKNTAGEPLALASGFGDRYRKSKMREGFTFLVHGAYILHSAVLMGLLPEYS